MFVMPRLTHFILRPAAILGCTIIAMAAGSTFTSASADSGPFSSFPGSWSGSGVIRVKDDNKQTTERVRCKATYRVSDGRAVGLRLGCKSDSYKFSLTGDFEADASNQVTGRWSEESYNIGGTAIGRAQDGRLRVHAEGAAFSAELSMVTRSSQQSVSLDSRGAGKRMTASITLRRN
jgi:hypothetical protein